MPRKRDDVARRLDRDTEERLLWIANHIRGQERPPRRCKLAGHNRKDRDQ